MQRTYEYRLYPRLLKQCRKVYQTTGQGQSDISQWAYFRDWRHAYPALILNASSLQHTLRRLDKAFASFVRRVKAGETPGYPRFQGARRFSSLEYTYGDGCHVTLVNPVYTSQACSRCGAIVPKELRVRVHRCRVFSED